MTVSINTPKLSTAEHLRQIEIGDEWLAENKKAIQPPKKEKGKKEYNGTLNGENRQTSCYAMRKKT